MDDSVLDFGLFRFGFWVLDFGLFCFGLWVLGLGCDVLPYYLAN